jgi:glycosyltransferase involved in cell wall biosynthesis
LNSDDLRILIENGSDDLRVGAVNDALDLAHFGRTLGAHVMLGGPIGSGFAAVAERSGISTICRSSLGASKRAFPKYATSVASWIAFLRRSRIEIVHINYAGYAPSLALAAHLLRIPVLARATCGYDASNRIHRWVSAYIANGDAHAAPLLDSPAAQKVRIIGDLFRPERLSVAPPERSIPSRAGAVRLLFLGQLVERKGIHVLIRAFARANVDADLLLVGGDWDSPGYAADLRSELDSLSLLTRVHRDNHRSDVAALLNDCDVLVVPSLSEARPRVIIEAMLLGKAVIASRVGGIPELIEHGKTGLLVPAEHVDSLVAAIQRLATSGAERVALGLAARQAALERFDPRRSVTNYLEVCRELLAGRPNVHAA